MKEQPHSCACAPRILLLPCRQRFEAEVASLQSSFEQMLHRLTDTESKHMIADTRASEAEQRAEALAAALNESRSRCALEQQQAAAMQLQLLRYESEAQSSKLLASQLAGAEACISDLHKKFNDADKRAFVAERRADALVQELRVRGGGGGWGCGAWVCARAFVCVCLRACAFHTISRIVFCNTGERHVLLSRA